MRPYGPDFIECLADDLLPPRGGVFVMVKVYFDRGAKLEAGGIMCVAASLFKTTPYRQFRKQWETVLKGWQATEFHATDFYSGYGEFKRHCPDGKLDPNLKARFDRDSRELPTIIGTHVGKLFLVSLKEQEFESVAPPAWREHFGTLPAVAAQMTASVIGYWSNRTNYKGPIAYVIEAGDDGREMERALRKMFDDPTNREHTRMAGYPTVVEKGRARGLEVSDFIAWHWNKFYVDSLATHTPRDMRKDIASLVKMLNMKQDQIELHLFTGEVLEKFLEVNGCVRV